MGEDWNRPFATKCDGCDATTRGYFTEQTHVSCPGRGLNLVFCSLRCANNKLSKVT